VLVVRFPAELPGWPGGRARTAAVGIAGAVSEPRAIREQRVTGGPPRPRQGDWRQPDWMSRPTAEIPRVEPEPPENRPPRQTPLTWLVGVLTGGLCVLALVMIGAQVYSSVHDMPGPGALTLTAHALAAALAVLLQRFVDRRTGPVRWCCAAGILVLTGLLLWFFWYS
jgi:hypothetical protein